MSRRSALLGVLVALCTLPTLSCDSLLTGVEMRRLELTDLAVTDLPMALHDSGVLFARAEFVVDGVQLSPDQRIPLTWTTSRGDRETTGMWHSQHCLRGTPYAPFPCFVLSVTLEEDANRAAIATRIFALGAVRAPISPGSRFGYVVVMDPRDLMSVAHRLRTWEEVRFVEIGAGPSCTNSERCVASPIRLGTGPAKPRDGVLQIAVGDTITVRYANPSGNALVSNILIIALQDRQ